ncbi:MAG: hypothetical protein ABI743_12090, partial [bacterium]
EDVDQLGLVILTSRQDGARGYLARALAMHYANANINVTIRPARGLRTGGGPSAKDEELVNPRGEVVVSLANTIGALHRGNVARGSVVIDGGYNFHLQRVSGDANFSELTSHVGMISPVPGGVEALSPLCVILNLLDLVKREIRWAPEEQGEAQGLRALRRLRS